MQKRRGVMASGLIESVDAARLSIAVPSYDMLLLAWNQCVEARPRLSRTLVDVHMFTLAIDALCLAADMVLAASKRGIGPTGMRLTCAL